MKDPKDFRITVGNIREQLSHLDDDCEVSFSCETGELFHSRVKSRGRDKNDRIRLISYEMSGEESTLTE